MTLLAILTLTAFAAEDPKPDEVEVRYIDGSVMKLRLRDPAVALSTPYGTLRIPADKIRKIEFKTRVSPSDAATAARAITDLGSPNFRTRELATATLLRLAEKAYPGLLKAVESETPEVASRAKKLIGEIRAKVPPDRLKHREDDLVITIDSRISGRLESDVIHVTTYQFGDQELKVGELMSMRSLFLPDPEPEIVFADPGNLIRHQNQFNAVLHFRVTGVAAGSVWGTGTYTSDSALAVAAVHAGVLKPGETGIVKVRVVRPPPTFQGSAKNGVSSAGYGAYPGAYVIEPRR